ncbi:hypothetical protein ACIFQM_24245 [Paenibacillus sp. NRS-1782]|uniref:hypothetical protein n=1 Tax=unclassified Paenibacillus TaxID=185978 RepID=UPI003D2BF1CF
MSVEQVSEQDKDYQRYLEFIRSRIYLTDTVLSDQIKYIYEKIYMITTIASALDRLNPRSFIGDFYYECKNNLIVCLDLCNAGYVNASKQILRSGIESFFRLSLAVEHFIEYRNNKRISVFRSTPSLQKLKALQQTHGVRKLTNFVTDFYSGKSVGVIYKDLNSIYSTLSGNVHVNKRENFTPHRFLIDYVENNKEKSSKYINDMENVVNLIIIAFYNFSLQLGDEGVVFSKRDITEFSYTLGSTPILDDIDSEYEKGIHPTP